MRIPFVGSAGFGACKAIGVIGNDGSPLAGIVWHDYQPQFKTIAFSIAAVSPRWATRRIIAQLLAYPFDNVGVFKLWTATPSDNVRALRMVQGLGFTREAILAHHFGQGRHAVINRMLRPQYEKLYRAKDVPVRSAVA